MQIKFLALLSTIALVKSDDVDFLTGLVNDYKSHTADYLKFIQTADSVPAALTSLAVQVATYTDDSYTTLLADSDINVSSLKAFATELPWYSRIEEDDGSDSDSDSKSDSSSSSSSSSAASSSEADSGVAKLGVGALLGLAGIALL
ncbi:repressed By RIM101 protein 2 [[Candida] jaroonii]|uniref:Repressed By RIM101 protein 2 n=1 Tax=[Candida] jaroonii TaxID=467808 RepID=A0ACA9YD27_9ASCO|nr:repressed By RIM101 protein 2 [[Candida] jaroonii]